MIEFENLKKSNKIFEEEFKEAFADFLDSGFYILGERLSCFETQFASYCGVEECIGVGSGLDAITLSLICEDFEPGSEIILPANTFIATILAVLHAGHKPVLVEPDLATYNITAENVAPLINSKTRAIVPVHLYGKMCDMDPLLQLAETHNLVLIEDAAQAHGATYKGRKAGSLGKYGAFSFYPVKNLGALGDGGAILTNKEQAEKLRMLRNYGSAEKYYYELQGYNSRLDDLQAAFLSIKLRQLDLINEHKRNLASIYFEMLKPDFLKPVVNSDSENVYHLYVIRHEKRDQLKAHLKNHGIETAVHYPLPPHKQNAVKFLFSNSSFPVTEKIHESVLSLPISFGHSPDEIRKVCEVMNRF